MGGLIKSPEWRKRIRLVIIILHRTCGKYGWDRIRRRRIVAREYDNNELGTEFRRVCF